MRRKAICAAASLLFPNVIVRAGDVPEALRPAVDDPRWTHVFSRVEKPRGWIGGDGGASLKLPDGRILFLFADTLVGTITADKKIGPNWRFVHNSLVKLDSDGTHFTLYTAGTPGSETSYFLCPAARPNSNELWPYTMVMDHQKLEVFANEWKLDPKGFNGHSYTGNVWVIQMNPTTLAIESMTQVVDNDPVQWGATAVRESGYTFVFGHLDSKAPQISTYLYRVPLGHITGEIEYRTRTGWSSDRVKAAPIADVDLEAVVRLPTGRWAALLVRNPYAQDILQASAPSLSGPWTLQKEPVFAITEARTRGLLQYMPRIHPALSDAAHWVMSYSIDAYNIRDVIAFAPNYQPHFFETPLPPR